jgi:hypothetical protein
LGIDGKPLFLTECIDLWRRSLNPSAKKLCSTLARNSEMSRTPDTGALFANGGGSLDCAISASVAPVGAVVHGVRAGARCVLFWVWRDGAGVEPLRPIEDTPVAITNRVAVAARILRGVSHVEWRA